MRRACDEIRRRLIAEGRGAETGQVREHLSGCAGCRRFAERTLAAREALRAHHADVRPDAAFAARVMSRLPGDEAGALGQAALRLIPASLILILLLSWFAIRTPASGVTTAVDQAAPTEDLVALIQALGEEVEP